MSVATDQNANALARRIKGATFPQRSWSVEGAYEFCREIATSHYENFPVGSLLIPRNLRKHFHAIYAFARIADDFADERHEEEYPETDRLELLAWWLELLRRSDRGQSEHPVFIALGRTRDEFELPISLFEDLISAFTQDVTVRRYQSFDELLDYCRRSANPIGRLILLLFGHRDSKLHSWSDEICTALQLTNHWQDVGIDLAKDRVYLPAEDLTRFDVTIDRLRRAQASPPFSALMAFEVERAREMFVRGKPLCSAIGGRLGLELRAVWLGGIRILEMIEARGYDVFTGRPVITSAGKLGILVRALRKGAL
jgi:phytoene synthase